MSQNVKSNFLFFYNFFARNKNAKVILSQAGLFHGTIRYSHVAELEILLLMNIYLGAKVIIIKIINLWGVNILIENLLQIKIIRTDLFK